MSGIFLFGTPAYKKQKKKLLLVSASLVVMLAVIIISVHKINETSNIVLNLDFDDNSTILFLTPNYIVSARPQKKSDGSLALCLSKTDIQKQTTSVLGYIDFVGIYNNDYVYISEEEIYSCFSYNNQQNKTRLIKINLTGSTIETIMEFESSFPLSYIEKMDNSKLLLFDIGDASNETKKRQAKVAIVDLNKKSIEKTYCYESTLNKIAVATYSNKQIYILANQDEKYNIEVFDTNFEKKETISLDDINYFFFNPDESIKTFQYLEAYNDTFLLTEIGGSSIVFTRNSSTGHLEEKYVGERLIPWNNTLPCTDGIYFYFTGQAIYSINYEQGLVEERLPELKNRFIQYSVRSFDNKNALFSIVSEKNDGKEYNRTYYLCNLKEEHLSGSENTSIIQLPQSDISSSSIEQPRLFLANVVSFSSSDVKSLEVQHRSIDSVESAFLDKALSQKIVDEILNVEISPFDKKRFDPIIGGDIKYIITLNDDSVEEIIDNGSFIVNDMDQFLITDKSYELSIPKDTTWQEITAS